MKANAETFEARYALARGRRTLYLIIVCIMVILPGIAYILDESSRIAPGEPLKYHLLNYGAYGLAGLLFVYFFVALIAALVGVFFTFRAAGLLMGAILAIPVFAIIVGVPIGLVEVFYANCNDAIVTWLSTHISGKMIPGISGTLGVAILCSLIYDVPFILCIWRLVVQWRRCFGLKRPAMEEKKTRELREQQAKEERSRQKQLQRERKEQEAKEHKEYERAVVDLVREAKLLREENKALRKEIDNQSNNV